MDGIRYFEFYHRMGVPRNASNAFSHYKIILAHSIPNRRGVCYWLKKTKNYWASLSGLFTFTYFFFGFIKVLQCSYLRSLHLLMIGYNIYKHAKVFLKVLSMWMLQLNYVSKQRPIYFTTKSVCVLVIWVLLTEIFCIFYRFLSRSK